VIYEYPEPEAPIRQGDVFIRLPRVEVSLEQMIVVDENERYASLPWQSLAKRDTPLVALVSVRPVAAMVITQDCDALRAPDITLCEIRPFREVELKGRDTTAAKSWMRILTRHARLNLKWFYLPPDDRVGFQEKMGVDFMVTLRVPRQELENLRTLRTGRLNEVADEHFRERLGDFFRRYPYDEWYPLDTEEFAAYRQDYPDAQPFPWQHVD
jgi:hypothetical protein